MTSYMFLISITNFPTCVSQIDHDSGFFSDSTALVHVVGLLLFALFQVVVTIVLVNMLIAMMSHSFEAVQVRDKY